jgi:alpha-tubulin suppressor-like RCC1 family protein
LTGVIAISAGADHNCALLSDGTVRCWGNNYWGDLGNGTSTGPETCQSGWPCSTVPVTVSGLAGVVAISAGSEETCALLADGTVQCWGLVNAVSTGPVTCQNGACATTPVAVPGLSEVTALARMCALLSDGTVECWPQCGETQCAATPVAVPGLSGVTAIASGIEVMCALLSGGTVECWGDNSYGELGDGTTTGPETCANAPCSTSPVVVSGLRGAVAVAAGGDDVCAVLADGTVECWGANESGQLGDGTSTGPETTCLGATTCSSTPVAVVGL